MYYFQLFDVTLTATGAGNHHGTQKLLFMVNRKGGQAGSRLKSNRQEMAFEYACFDKIDTLQLF